MWVCVCTTGGREVWEAMGFCLETLKNVKTLKYVRTNIKNVHIPIKKLHTLTDNGKINTENFTAPPLSDTAGSCLLQLSYCSMFKFTHIHISSFISYLIVNLCMPQSPQKNCLIHEGGLGTLCSFVSFFSAHSLMPTELILGPLSTFILLPT